MGYESIVGVRVVSEKKREGREIMWVLMLDSRAMRWAGDDVVVGVGLVSNRIGGGW